MAIRQIQSILRAHPTSDGDGVKIQRVHGFENAAFSPFLMLDELKSDQAADYVGGFPPHPHRGIETLTYMLKGHFQHQDHMGNRGELKDGGAQWMSAGKGVIHSEMPVMTDGQLHGFQIWINLPARKKMQPAQYHDFQSDVIAEKQLSRNNLIRVIAGDLTIEGDTVTGPLQETGVPTTIADWQTTAGGQLNSCLNPDFQAMLYVYQGAIEIDGRTANAGELVILDAGEGLSVTATQDTGMLLLSGLPIHEPVVHYGPFVMNSIDEIEQAIHDYQTGTLTD
ncbi:pirin family protein [Photobacterium galatheae]|uniref:Quercetin 2,3-dioxygenase n=1 Tax=Photobacterium galatheae TaxID=1654360 RepID=A0A066RLK2_9GAMM|nr:pirin family protein [Photobacterium galatheae]KDM91325.1 quercetin 2,3-dioxygenase [Photobacterium galatheae]MCM0150275.1 pirin family protein [Photobacterium galatheae]